jgi:hypothetical protein
MHSSLRHLLDGVSITTILATLVGWLPHVAAVLSIVWTMIRIWETDTAQKLKAKWSRQS